MRHAWILHVGAGLLLLAMSMTACGPHYSSPGGLQPGYVIAGAQAREVYGISVDTVREVPASVVPRRVRAAARQAADSVGFDPYCIRFFTSAEATVLRFSAWCDIPVGTLSDNAIAYRVYRTGVGAMGPLLSDWRAWFPDVNPYWQPPLDSAKARKTQIKIRGK